MIPHSNISEEDFLSLIDADIEHLTSRDYKIRESENRIIGYVDSIESVKQACNIICNTERGRYMTFKDDTGIELDDLYGKDVDLVTVLLEERITEALEEDDRINTVNIKSIRTNGRGKFFVEILINTIFDENLEHNIEVVVK